MYTHIYIYIHTHTYIYIIVAFLSPLLHPEQREGGDERNVR